MQTIANQMTAMIPLIDALAESFRKGTVAISEFVKAWRCSVARSIRALSRAQRRAYWRYRKQDMYILDALNAARIFYR